MATSVTSPPRVSPAQQPETKAGPPTTQVILKWVVPIGLGVVLRLIPAPAGLAPLAWHYFALFAAVIAALVTEPLPGAAVGLIGISIAAAYMLIGKTPAEAVRWLIWERFARGERHAATTSGSGLGLWIANAFIAANGGKMNAASAGPGQGSTVAIEFPLTKDAVPQLETDSDE